MSAESQTYICYNKGCSSGGSFIAAPESWFREKGLTPPRNCPGCREWIKAQADERVDCSTCSWPMPISAKRKISYHRREGPWLAPSLCAICNLDPERAKRSAAAKERTRVRRRANEPNEVQAVRLRRILEQRNRYPGQPRPIRISAEPSWWQTTSRDYRLQGSQTLWDHIVSRHGAEIQASAQLLSSDHVPSYISELAASTDGKRVVELNQGTKMVKLDIMTSIALVYDPKSGLPVTCIAKNADSIQTKLRKGQWS